MTIAKGPFTVASLREALGQFPSDALIEIAYEATGTGEIEITTYVKDEQLYVILEDARR